MTKVKNSVESLNRRLDQSEKKIRIIDLEYRSFEIIQSEE